MLIDITTHQLSKAQEQALSSYQHAWACMLRPYIFQPKRKGVQLRVPALDLGALNHDGLFNVHMQLRNTCSTPLLLTVEATGDEHFQRMVTFVFHNQPLCPGLTTTIVAEFDPSTCTGGLPPTAPAEVLGVILVRVSQPSSSSSRGASHRPTGAVTKIEMPVFFVVD